MMQHSHGLVRPCWIALVAALLFAAPAAADPKVTVTTSYYTVDGNSVDELRDQMNRNGLKGFWAYTSWYVSWSAACHVSLRIVYTLPRWRSRDVAPAELRTKWDKFLASLITHERGHGTHGRNAASEIDHSRCATNPGNIIRRWANQDRTYDITTRHGRTQGAEF